MRPRLPRSASLVLCTLVLCACGGNESSPSKDAGPDARPPPPALGCGHVPSDTIDVASGHELALSGDVNSTEGVFDPSIVYPKGAASGAMSYSSVAAKNAIRTRIAVSTDQGASFTTVADANAPMTLTVPSSDGQACPGGMCTGSLIHEVSSLVLDSDDPDPNRRWKLFSHRYLVLPGDKLRYDYGNIVLQTAAAPEGPWSADIVAMGWTSTSPFSAAGATQRLGDIPELMDCVAATEPAAVIIPGVSLDLALGCISLSAGQPSIRVVLLRSKDHGASFSYVSTLLTPTDAPCFDADTTRVNAADLFFVGADEYLLVTPESATTGYHGCVLLPIDDPQTGAVRRDSVDQPVFFRRIDVSTGQFAGACTYAEGATALGVAMSVGFLMDSREFRVFSTGLALP